MGHTQIPGVDFTDNFSGVVHDVTLRMILIFWIVLNLDVDQMDVETAFLEEDLKESKRVLLSHPPGMKLEADECLEVRKGMCGLVQSARKHWFKMTEILKSHLKLVS